MALGVVSVLSKCRWAVATPKSNPSSVLIARTGQNGKDFRSPGPSDGSWRRS